MVVRIHVAREGEKSCGLSVDGCGSSLSGATPTLWLLVNSLSPDGSRPNVGGALNALGNRYLYSGM